MFRKVPPSSMGGTPSRTRQADSIAGVLFCAAHADASTSAASTRKTEPEVMFIGRERWGRRWGRPMASLIELLEPSRAVREGTAALCSNATWLRVRRSNSPMVCDETDFTSTPSQGRPRSLGTTSTLRIQPRRLATELCHVSRVRAPPLRAGERTNRIHAELPHLAPVRAFATTARHATSSTSGQQVRLGTNGTSSALMTWHTIGPGTARIKPL